MKDALNSALRALVARNTPSGREAEYRYTLEALRSTTSALGGGPRPPAHRKTAAAFQAATDAIYLVRGIEPPFGEAEANGSLRATVGSVEHEFQEARTDVLKLGQSKWGSYRQASARALSSIADVVEASAAVARPVKRSTSSASATRCLGNRSTHPPV